MYHNTNVYLEVTGCRSTGVSDMIITLITVPPLIQQHYIKLHDSDKCRVNISGVIRIIQNRITSSKGWLKCCIFVRRVFADVIVVVIEETLNNGRFK